MANKPEDDKIEFEIESPDVIAEGEKPELVVEDDTPPEDRGREPLPKEIVQELENDELDSYSEKVKIRLKQMKKVWHDERREKEREAREKAEALSVVQRIMEENKRLKRTLSQGENTLINSVKQNAEFEVRDAERAFREAYEAADTDKIVETQRKLNEATYKLQQITAYKPTLQDNEDGVVEETQQVQAPRLDPKTIAWQERNKWWGNDPEMTASALGLHQKLVQERGPQYAGSDEYWDAIDKTMRRRFPDYFGDEVASSRPAPRESKPATVVAPASRSRSSKKIVLKQSQLAIAQRLGLTPEQYARELMKMEG